MYTNKCTPTFLNTSAAVCKQYTFVNTRQESRSRAATLLYPVGNVKCEIMVRFQTGLHFINVVSCPIETKVCKRAETLSVSKTVNNKDKFMA